MNYNGMKIDMRTQTGVRDQVHASMMALKVQARQIWGDRRYTLFEVTVRLMVGVGDLARLARDRGAPIAPNFAIDQESWNHELKKELGNIVFSTIRWIDDLGLDVLECLDLAIEAQEKFANSGRPR
jgi:hypothetical protein